MVAFQFDRRSSTKSRPYSLFINYQTTGIFYMEIDVRELIAVIANRHGIDLSDNGSDVIEQLKNLSPDLLTDEFLESWNSIIAPMLERSVKNEEITREEIRELIPDDIYVHLHPIDPEGRELLSMAELRESLFKDDLFYRDRNSNEVVDKIRQHLKSSYAHDDYPIMSSLESSWKLLSEDYKVIDRHDHPAKTPVESFVYFVEMGFYPTPELLMFVKEGFDLYLHSRGEISLDEAFFGEKYKKKSSFSFRKSKDFKYGVLETSAKFMQRKKNISFEA